MTSITNFPPYYWPPVHSSDGGGKSAFSPAVVSVIAVLGSAFLVVSYYRIFAKFCTRWQSRRDELEAHTAGFDSDMIVSPLPNYGLEQSLIKKIPIFVYKTGETFTEDTDCPVCLGEFLDHQELRLLPKCAHAFHVACIDTWLSSHGSCPLCRAPIFPEQQMRQSVQGLYPGEMRVPPHLPGSERMDYTFVDGVRFGPLGPERMTTSPTLRGLLNYEDAHSIWIPSLSLGRTSLDEMLVIDPGEESRRLSETREHEQAYLAWAAAAIGVSANEIPVGVVQGDDNNRRASGESRSGTYFSTPVGPQVALTRTASFKESSNSRSRDREHKWHIPSRRFSFRKNPFSIVVRSYSMGTSRRHVHAMEFLDLDEFRAGQRRSSTSEFPATPASTLSVFSTTSDGMNAVPHLAGSSSTTDPEKAGSSSDGAGPSTRIKETPVCCPPMTVEGCSLRPTDPEKAEASIKSSSARGRSRSFRSPFSLRSLSSGRSMFSFRMDHHSSRGRIFSMDSPPNS